MKRHMALILIGTCVARGASLPVKFHAETAKVSKDTAVEQWWSTFHDPDLDSLIERAVRANPDLKIAASRVLEARAGLGVTRARWSPAVEASGNPERVRGGLPQGFLRPNTGGRSSLLAPFETNFFQQGFDASWEIDFFGGKRHALEAASADIKAAEEAGRETRVSLLAEVARNYGDLRAAQKRLEIAKRNIALETDTLALTRVRAEAGLGTELDVERQASQVATVEAKLPILESAVQMSLHRLSVLLGEKPDALDRELATAKPVPATPAVVPVGLPGDLLKRRPDVRRADSEVAAASARVGVARSDLFPKFTLTGGAGRQGTSFSGLTLGAANFFSFGPAIKLPVFTGGRLKANMAIQKERLIQAQLEYQKTVLRSLEETENALTAYSREQERRERLEQAAQSGRAATRLANELYTRGLVDFITVLDSERRQLTMEDELAQSDAGVFIDLVALYKALGGGWGGGPSAP